MDYFQQLQHWPIEALLAIVAGIVVLAIPRVLNHVLAVYLLAIGLLGLLQFWYGHGIRPHALAALVAGMAILIRPAILHYVIGTYLIFIGILELGLRRL